MGSTQVTDWTMIATVLFALLMFGVAYAFIVYVWLQERAEGYTSLLVVAGVIVTLLGVALVDWQAAVLTLAAFTASGLPMVLGDIIRAIHKRDAHLRLMRLVANAQAKDISDET